MAVYAGSSYFRRARPGLRYPAPLLKTEALEAFGMSPQIITQKAGWGHVSIEIWARDAATYGRIISAVGERYAGAAVRNA
jgi:hypothetical protein